MEKSLIADELSALFAARAALLSEKNEFRLTCNGVEIPMVGALWERLWEVADEEVSGAIIELAEALHNGKA